VAGGAHQRECRGCPRARPGRSGDVTLNAAGRGARHRRRKRCGNRPGVRVTGCSARPAEMTGGSVNFPRPGTGSRSTVGLAPVALRISVDADRHGVPERDERAEPGTSLRRQFATSSRAPPDWVPQAAGRAVAGTAGHVGIDPRRGRRLPARTVRRDAPGRVRSPWHWGWHRRRDPGRRATTALTGWCSGRSWTRWRKRLRAELGLQVRGHSRHDRPGAEISERLAGDVCRPR